MTTHDTRVFTWISQQLGIHAPVHHVLPAVFGSVNDLLQHQDIRGVVGDFLHIRTWILVAVDSSYAHSIMPDVGDDVTIIIFKNIRKFIINSISL